MASACGKVILFGEHAAVYDHPALAVGIPNGVRTIRVEPTDGPIQIHVQPWGLTADPHGPGAVGRGVALLDRLVPGARRGMRAELLATIPPGAGLGSSAALSVALVRALSEVRGAGLDDRGVRRLAHALEEVFHGRPSGLDDTVATYGGLCLFKRCGFTSLPEPNHQRLTEQAYRLPLALPPLVIGHTGVARSTADMVNAVRSQREDDPARVDGLFATVDACLSDGLAALRSGDTGALGAAMTRNQAVLAELGLSCSEIDTLIGLADLNGASGAKLTGAGGGGSVVALAPGREEALVEAWQGAGFAAQAVRFRQARGGVMSAASSAEAVARTNIALVKYWGKADRDLNLPAVGSLSLTLSGLSTRTRVTFDAGLAQDSLLLDGQPAPEAARLRASGFLDLIRALAGNGQRARVESVNSFPTAAGLASSASGFCALAAAAARAAGLDLSKADLAELTRQGSGSAPRSLLGGFVELHPEPGCRLTQLAPADHWDLRMVIALCADGPKAVGSTEGMERSRRTSAYYPAWVESHPADLERARLAIAARDLQGLGRVAEASCFKMHALAMSSDPPLIYFRPATLAAVERVWRLRREGLEGYVTIDAGPHVKVLCAAAAAEGWAAELARVDGVRQVMVEAPGPGVEVAA